MSTVLESSVQPGCGTVSPLLDRLQRLGLQLPLDLERLAVARGLGYYARNLAPRVSPLGEVPVTNAELAIALISPLLSPAAREIRLAGALLGDPGIPVERVARFAVQEGCEVAVRHIALCGHRYEPQNSFWTSLLEQLPDVAVDADWLPHPTRFVEMTGIDRGRTGFFTRWIRPHGRQAA